MNYLEYNVEDLQSFSYSEEGNTDGSLVGNFTKGTAEIELLNDSNEYSSFIGKWMYTPLGLFYIYEVEPVQEKISIRLKCYDIKYLFDKKYENSKYESLFPCDIATWRNKMAEDLGVTFNDNNNFPLHDMILDSHPYVGDDVSYANVFQQLSQACISFITKDSDDYFYFSWLKDSITIDDWFELTTEKESTAPINVLVLGRGDVEDNVIYPEIEPDDPSEFRIDNNYIIDPQDTNTYDDKRELVKEELFNRIKDFKYIVYDMTARDISDIFSINIGSKIKYNDIWGNTLESIVMNKKLNWLGGELDDPLNWEINISAEKINESTTDYSYSHKTSSLINTISRKTDKNELKIEDLINTVHDITDYINIVKSDNELHLTNTMNSNGSINYIKIKNFSKKSLYPNTQYPSSYTFANTLTQYTLIMSNKPMLFLQELPAIDDNTENIYISIYGKVYKIDSNKNEWVEVNEDAVKYFSFISPIALQTNEETSDEVILSNGSCLIKQNVNSNGETLSKTINHQGIISDTFLLQTYASDTYIYFDYFDNLNYECEYLQENDLTKIFATTAEMQAVQTLTEEGWKSFVKKAELSTEISQTAETITLSNGQLIIDMDNFHLYENGDVELSNGAKIIGGYGLLTSLQFISSMNNDFGGGYSLVGIGSTPDYNGKWTFEYEVLNISVDIPKNFTIDSAYLTLYHTCADIIDSSGINQVGCASNLAVYRAKDGTNLKIGFQFMGEYKVELPEMTEVTSIGYPDSNYYGKVETMQPVDIKDCLKEGNNILFVKTKDTLPSPSSTNTISAQKTGFARAVVNIIGYQAFEKESE